MLKSFKVNQYVWVATDAEKIALFEQNINEKWDVYIPATNEYIASDLDDIDAAESTAFQWLSQVSA
jgi:hypothetical protein